MPIDTANLGEVIDVGAGTAFLKELQETSESLKQLQQEMRERFVELKTLADEWEAIPEREMTIALAHAEDVAAAVREACAHAASEIESTLEATATSLTDHFGGFVTATGEQFSQWEGVHAAFNEACSHFLDQCSAAVEAAGHGFDGFKGEVEHLQSLLEEVGTQNTSAFDTIRGTLTGQWTSDMSSSSEAFTTELTGSHTQQAIEHFNSSRDKFEELRAALDQGLREHGADFDTEISNAFNEVVQHLQSRMQSGLQDAGEKVLDGATTRVKQEILQGIVMSNVGAQTTTAMTPVIPYLIAIKAAADALCEAIRLWKELKSGFGLFG